MTKAKSDAAVLARWPGASVELVPLKSLLPDARNARTHSPEQVAVIAGLMLSHGFTSPVLRDETNNIIAGHGRVLAAALNLERGHAEFAMVPVITARCWSEAQRRAYVLADNQTALRAGWDMALLGGELAALTGMGVDLASIGFTADDLAPFAPKGNTDPDEVPPVPAVALSKRGDLWLLGEHRVLCGDATKAEDVGRAVGDAKPHLMVTDPPYGVEYDADWRNRADRANGTPYGASAIGKVQNDEQMDWTPAWRLFGGDVAYCWHADRHASRVQSSLEACGLIVRSQIIWVKDRLIISRGDYHRKHEPCWYAVRKGRKGHWSGDRSQVTAWEIPHAKSETGHSTQKPVEAMRRPIVNNSKRGDSVYDPFLGSGTTVIAAEMEGRRCFGLKIDPAYVEVCIRRWEAFTGMTATREDGATLADLGAATPALTGTIAAAIA